MAIDHEQKDCVAYIDRSTAKYYFVREGQSTGEYKERSATVGKNYALDCESTAVVKFLLERDLFNSVEDIYEAATSFADPKQFAEHHNVAHDPDSDLCADHRKIYWCKHAQKWKMAAFYLKTPLDKAMSHAHNRELLEPWLGKGYRAIGCDDGATFAYTNQLLTECIEICQATLLSAEENKGFAFYDAQALQRLNKHISSMIV